MKDAGWWHGCGGSGEYGTGLVCIGMFGEYDAWCIVRLIVLTSCRNYVGGRSVCFVCASILLCCYCVRKLLLDTVGFRGLRVGALALELELVVAAGTDDSKRGLSLNAKGKSDSRSL